MTTQNATGTAEEQALAQRTLEETPAKAITFINGIGSSMEIRVVMQDAGYTKEEHTYAWEHLQRVAGSETSNSPPTAAPDITIQSATEEIEVWAGKSLPRMQAGLNRLYPAVEEFIFAGVDVHAKGAEAVLMSKTVLDRMDILDAGTARKATHKEDLAANKSMATRGFTSKERKRVQQLIETAQAGAQEPTPTKVDDADKKAAQRQTDLVELHAWYVDWTTTARHLITRRDHLIRLGLAKRRPSAKAKAKAAEKKQANQAKKAAKSQTAPAPTQKSDPAKTASSNSTQAPAESPATTEAANANDDKSKASGQQTAA